MGCDRQLNGDLKPKTFTTHYISDSGYVDKNTSEAYVFTIGEIAYIYFVLQLIKEVEPQKEINLIVGLPRAIKKVASVAALGGNGDVVKLNIDAGSTQLRTSAWNFKSIPGTGSIVGTIIYRTVA